MNVQSVCSVLDKGSRVRISAQGTHKSPHLNGVEGVIHAMPVHPTTWFKVQFPSGEIATFRSSALIPLDVNGAPIPGFGAENRASSAAYRQDSKGISSVNGERDDVETIYGSGNRRVLREHSGHYLNSAMDQDHSTSRSSRPRSSSLGPGGRAVATGFRSNFYTNAASNSRFTSKATEADRKIFNDFVEVAYASAYVPDCAHNTHGQGVIATKQLANEGPCDKCGIRRVRAGSVAGGFCWNSYCPSSPLYGRGAKQQPREERPHSRSMSSFHSEAEMARADGMQGRNEARQPTIKDVNASDSTFYPVSPMSSSSSLTNVGSSMSLSMDGVGHGTDRNGHIVSSSSSTTSLTECATSDNYTDVSMQTPMGGGDGSGATDTRTPNGFQKVASSDSNGSVGAEGERGARSWSFHSADSDGTLSQSFGGLVADPDSAFTSIKDEGGDEKPIKTRGVRARLSDPDDQGQMATVVSNQALSELSGSAGEGGAAITTTTIDTAATAKSSQAGQSRPDPSDAGAAAVTAEQAVTTGPAGKKYPMNVEYEPWQKRPRRAE